MEKSYIFTENGRCFKSYLFLFVVKLTIIVVKTKMF